MKRFKNLINQKLDKEIYKLARHEVQLILYKKKHFLRRLNDSTGKPKELWKALKSLDLPNKTSLCGTNAL